MSLRVVPVGVAAARLHIETHHSHHHAPCGGLLAAAVADGDRVCCVALLGRPVARMLDQRGNVAEVTRVASDGTKHAASMAIAAVTRAAVALGWRRIVSYTLIGEAGTSYKAAGWRVTGLVEASQGWHSRAGRTISQGGGKVRWETGPEALPEDPAAVATMLAAVGVAVVPERPENLPLLRGIQ